jgi:hypothetical protein
MTWATPKTNWATDDVIATTDLNRIEENERILRQGNGYSALQNIALSSGVTVTLPNSTDDVFTLTLSGTPTGVSYISTTGRTAGNRVKLIVVGSIGGGIYLQLKAGSVPSNHAAIAYFGGGQVVEDMMVLEFIYDGTYWVFCNKLA